MINQEWLQTENTLCLRPDNLGDVIMTGPALRALKNFGKNRKITLLTSTMGAVIARHMPEIDETIVFNVPWVKADSTGGPAEVMKLVEEIKKRNFDSAVIFTNYSQNPLPTAMLCYLAGIPLVLGYCRENPYKLINTWIPDHEPFLYPKHSVRRLLELVESVGAKAEDDGLRLSVPKDTEIRQKLAAIGVNMNKPWLLLHPGVSENKRQYPIENYIEAGKKIVGELGYQVVVTGSEEEAPQAEKVAKQIGAEAFSIAGKIDIAELIALIGLAPLLISNNTGPIHIAAAVQTPVVDMYARTNPEHTPWKVKSKVLYFDVPKKIRSKNTTLVFITPRQISPMPTADDIVAAAAELLNIENYAKSFSPNSNLQPGLRFSRDLNKPVFPGV